MRFLELKDTTTACPYLPDREFSAENFLAPNIKAQELDRLLAGGYRHFGSYYFRPVCKSCTRCVPLRLRTAGYSPSKSIKRLLSKNRDLQVAMSAPFPSERSYSLYRKHQLRFEQHSSSSYDQYVRSFCSPTVGNMQLSVYRGDLLLSVIHLDVTAESLSAVYCYYDTDYDDRSLGTYSVAQALRYARACRVDFAYLGYVVEGNRHMAYKTRYRPNEMLVGEGWIPYIDRDGTAQNAGRYLEGFPGRSLRASYRSILLSTLG